MPPKATDNAKAKQQAAQESVEAAQARMSEATDDTTRKEAATDAQKALDEQANAARELEAAAQEELRQATIAKLKAEEEAMAKANEGKILVNVPKAFNLRLGAHDPLLRIESGVQYVTPEIFEHFYSKANGMKAFTRGE